jgi:Fur family transcriptional regulator, ferric uptake regulator
MTKEAAQKEFKDFLKRGDNRITPERFEVLDFAMDYKGHFGADELFVKMKTGNSDVSRATVYNTVELLAQCGLVTKRNFGENKTIYESNINKKSHDHLICTTCGSIKEFSEPKISKIVKELSESIGFIPDSYSFNIYGKCTNPNCGQIKNAK